MWRWWVILAFFTLWTVFLPTNVLGNRLMKFLLWTFNNWFLWKNITKYLLSKCRYFFHNYHLKCESRRSLLLIILWLWLANFFFLTPLLPENFNSTDYLIAEWKKFKQICQQSDEILIHTFIQSMHHVQSSVS